MGRPTEAQWMVARVVSEGAPPTRGRVAGMLGVEVSSVYARAAAEGWRTLDWRSGTLQTLQAELVAANEAERNGEIAPVFAPADGVGGAAPPGMDGAAPPATARGQGAAADGEGADGGAARPDGAPDLDGAALEEAGRFLEAARGRLANSAGAVAAGAGDPVAVLARAGAFIARQVEGLIDRAERADGRLDKRRVEALTALARMMERWEAIARERASQDEDCNDAELAEFLRRVDERIVELAALEARRLVAAGYRPPQDA
jgi:hypothetical protein